MRRALVAVRHRLAAAQSRYTLSVGSSSRDLEERARFEIGRHKRW
jgi:hypothetical protein